MACAVGSRHRCRSVPMVGVGDGVGVAVGGGVGVLVGVGVGDGVGVAMGVLVGVGVGDGVAVGSRHRCRSVCRRRWSEMGCRRRGVAVGVWRWCRRGRRCRCTGRRRRGRRRLSRYGYCLSSPRGSRRSPRLRAVSARRHRRGRQDYQQADPDDPTRPPPQTTECEEDVSHCVAILPTMPRKSMTPRAYGVSLLQEAHGLVQAGIVACFAFGRLVQVAPRAAQGRGRVI